MEVVMAHAFARAQPKSRIRGAVVPRRLAAAERLSYCLSGGERL